MNASTITYLLDRDCKMRFESSEQMSNHAKKVFIIFIYIYSFVLIAAMVIYRNWMRSIMLILSQPIR